MEEILNPRSVEAYLAKPED